MHGAQGIVSHFEDSIVVPRRGRLNIAITVGCLKAHAGRPLGLFRGAP
jgi:hypothetical protein